MGRRRELIISAVLAVVVVAGLWALLVRPKAGQAAAAQAQEREAAARAETLRGQISALEQARSEAPSLRARAHEAGDPFPAKPDLPDLTSALQKVAQQAGVDLLSIQPSSPVASAASPELAVLATTVSVSGGYFEIEDFLSRLENLVKSPDPASRIPPRSVLVRSVSLSGSSSGGGGTSGGTSGTATATTTGATTLTANIGLAVFQHAKAKTAAGTTTTTAGGR